MLRLVGIFTGSALAVALMIVTLGMPRFSSPGASSVTADGAPATEAEATPGPIEAESLAPEPVPVSPPEKIVEAPLSEAETGELIDQTWEDLRTLIAAYQDQNKAFTARVIRNSDYIDLARQDEWEGGDHDV